MLKLYNTATRKMENFKPTVLKILTTTFLMVTSIFSLGSISAFLYFNF